MPRDTLEPGATWISPTIDLKARDAEGNPIWLTPSQAAAVATVSEKTLRRWLHRHGHDFAVQTPSGRWYIFRPRLVR